MSPESAGSTQDFAAPAGADLLEKLASAHSRIALDGGRFGITLRWIEETPGYDLGYASLEEAVLTIDGLLKGERRANRP